MTETSCLQPAEQPHVCLLFPQQEHKGVCVFESICLCSDRTEPFRENYQICSSDRNLCFFHVFICFFFLFRCCFFFWYIFSLSRVCVCVQVVSVNTRAGSVCTRKKTKAEASERCLNDIPKLGFKVGSARSFSLLSSLFFSYSLSRLSVCLILIFDYFLFFPGR